VLAGCGNAAGPFGGGAREAAGLSIRIALPGAENGARTITPALASDLKYHIAAEAQSGGAAGLTLEAEAPDAIRLVLADAVWTITAAAYRGEWGSGEERIGSGSAQVTVTNGAAAPASVTIILSPNEENHSPGALVFTVTGTSYEAGSEVIIKDETLSTLPDLDGTTEDAEGDGTLDQITFVDGTAVLTGPVANEKLALAPGKYLVTIVLKDGAGYTAQYTQAVEVWPALVSGVSFNAAADTYVDQDAIAAVFDGIAYASLQKALSAAGAAEGTVILKKDAALSDAPLSLPDGVTLDTAGHSLADAGGSVIALAGVFTAAGDVTLTDAEAAGGHLVLGAGASAAITGAYALSDAVLDLSAAGASLTISRGTVVTVTASAGHSAGLRNASGNWVLTAEGSPLSAAFTGTAETAQAVAGALSVYEGAIYMDAPTVTAVDPLDAEEGVSKRIGAYVITLSEPVLLAGETPIGAWNTDLAATLPGFTFVSGVATDEAAKVTGAVYDETAKTITLTLGLLDYETTYTVGIAGLEDAVGNPLAPLSKTFSTAASGAKIVRMGARSGGPVTYGTPGTYSYHLRAEEFTGTGSEDVEVTPSLTWYAAQSGGDPVSGPALEALSAIHVTTIAAGPNNPDDDKALGEADLTLTSTGATPAGTYWFTVTLTGGNGAASTSVRASFVVERAEITTFEVGGIDAPETTVTLDTEAAAVANTSGTTVVWKVIGEGGTETVESESAAQPARRYAAHLVLSADSNHVFNISEITVNGNSAYDSGYNDYGYSAGIKYTVTSGALANDTITVQAAYPITEPETLAAVTDAALAEDGTVSWTAIPHAVSYDVQLYKVLGAAVGADGDDPDTAIDAAVNVSAAPAAVLALMRSEGLGTYYVTVTAKGDGIVYLDAAPSAASNTREVTQAAPPSGALWTASEGLGAWTASPTAGIAGYVLQLKKGAAPAGEPVTVGADTTTYDFTTLIGGEEGLYTFTALSKGAPLQLDSAPVMSNVLAVTKDGLGQAPAVILTHTVKDHIAEVRIVGDDGQGTVWVDYMWIVDGVHLAAEDGNDVLCLGVGSGQTWEVQVIAEHLSLGLQSSAVYTVEEGE
jgi:hypothetical protein